jgi:hypothetical protein
VRAELRPVERKLTALDLLLGEPAFPRQAIRLGARTPDQAAAKRHRQETPPRASTFSYVASNYTYGYETEAFWWSSAAASPAVLAVVKSIFLQPTRETARDAVNQALNVLEPLSHRGSQAPCC